jgi:carboxyl-terminal processing protease
MNAQGTPFTISPQTTVTILINEWSASASEILAWTIKDYHLATTLIGQKTFGKWSVQMLDQYDDGSSIKYTVARRYTGKSQTAIDRVGIMPDLVIASTGSQDLALQAALQR